MKEIITEVFAALIILSVFVACLTVWLQNV